MSEGQDEHDFRFPRIPIEVLKARFTEKDWRLVWRMAHSAYAQAVYMTGKDEFYRITLRRRDGADIPLPREYTKRDKPPESPDSIAMEVLGDPDKLPDNGDRSRLISRQLGLCTAALEIAKHAGGFLRPHEELRWNQKAIAPHLPIELIKLTDEPA